MTPSSTAAWIPHALPIPRTYSAQTSRRIVTISSRRSTPHSAPLFTPPNAAMKVAVAGCVHGELDTLYAAVAEAERAQGTSVDLVLCAGDLQAVRNARDLQCMAAKPWHRHMRSFHKYYSGTTVAPRPTLFVGGNHEASNHLQELPLGGLVAPNVYFLGNAGVVSYGGVRFAGVSGVYTEHNYAKPRTEAPPYPRSQVRSVYHTRREDVERLLRVRREVDVVVSHDWPRGIVHAGSLGELLKAKPFLRGEIADGSFGNPGATAVLEQLQPPFWFAAHMHVKFPALVNHPSGKQTRFLALDKALPKRDFIQIIDIPVRDTAGDNMHVFSDRISAETLGEKDVGRIDLDAEWLSILRTEAAESGRGGGVTDEEMAETIAAMHKARVKSYVLPVSDFERTAEVYDGKGNEAPPPSHVELQRGNVELIKALEMDPDAWLPGSGGVSGGRMKVDTQMRPEVSTEVSAGTGAEVGAEGSAEVSAKTSMKTGAQADTDSGADPGVDPSAEVCVDQGALAGVEVVGVQAEMGRCVESGGNK